LPEFNEIWIFPDRLCEKYSNLKFHKTHPVGTELFHVDGETDGQTEEKEKHMAKLMVTLCSVAKALKCH